MITPVLLFTLLIAVDFGRLFFSYIQLTNAAREAAAYGATQPTDQVGMEQRAAQEKNAQGQAGEGTWVLTRSCATPGGASIACGTAAGGAGAGNTLTVTVSEPFSFMTPFINGFFGGSLDIDTSATSAVLVTAPSGGGGGGPGGCSAPTVATFVVTSVDLTVTVDPTGSEPTSGVCAISGYNWDFGDGESAPGSTVPSTHEFALPGTYTITLEVTNQGGSLVKTETVTVPEVAPTPTPGPTVTPTPGPTATPTPTPTPTATPCAKAVPNFTWDSDKKTVTFDSTSSTTPAGCPITNWLWDFGDGSNPSNAQNPTHTYQTGASVDVTLTLTNSAGNASVTKAVKP